jgi:uncharacterized membrane protein
MGGKDRSNRGRALAWASDIGPDWCPQGFTTWSGYGTLWRNALSRLAGSESK